MNNRRKRIIELSELIKKVFDTPTCENGGYAHAVIDDGNTEDHSVDFALKRAQESSIPGVTEDGRTASIECLLFMVEMSDDERNEALYHYHHGNFWIDELDDDE